MAQTVTCMQLFACKLTNQNKECILIKRMLIPIVMQEHTPPRQQPVWF